MTARSDSAHISRAIKLPVPICKSDVSIAMALERRQTIRTISARPLSMQTLSDLLWAACGVNRKQGPFGAPGRTAASASNSQEIEVYVALEEGAFLYEAVDQVLLPVADKDIRDDAMTFGQRGISVNAPVQLIYVANLYRLTHTDGFQEPGLHDPEVKKSYYYVDTGLIAGNIYLFCAATGLAAWFHHCDKQKIAADLGLHEEQRVLFAQSVGYPDEP
jgi:hypothetical protein